jgi:hypothetical protein
MWKFAIIIALFKKGIKSDPTKLNKRTCLED